MAYSAGKNITLSYNSQSIGAFCSNVTLTRNNDTLDVTTFGDSDREFITGLRSAQIQISGYFDSTATSGPDATLAAAYALSSASSFTLTFGVGGSPTVAYSGSAWVSSYETTGAVDGLIAFSATLQANGTITRT